MTHTNFRDSSVAFRILYCIALVIAVIPQLASLRYGWLLIAQMPRNQNIVNPAIAMFSIVLPILFGVLVAYRIWSIATRRSRLSHVSERGFLAVGRAISAFLIGLFVVLWVISLAGLLYSRIGAVSLITASFMGFLPSSLLAFELCRVMGLEHRTALPQAPNPDGG